MAYLYPKTKHITSLLCSSLIRSAGIADLLQFYSFTVLWVSKHLSREYVVFELNNTNTTGLLEIYDTQGRIVHIKQIVTNAYTLPVKEWVEGVYLYRYTVEGQQLHQGKITIIK